GFARAGKPPRPPYRLPPRQSRMEQRVQRESPNPSLSRSDGALGRIVILGAGPCGLGAAWRLRELGHGDFQVFEQAAHVGGLASSFTGEGFTWDIGGHVMFSHYQYYDDVFA